MKRFKMKLNTLLTHPLIGRFLSFVNKDTGVKKTSWAVWAAIVFCFVFHMHYIHILNLFYHVGAGFGDAGLFAAVAWRNDLRLTTPLAYDAGNVSFFSLHFTPLLWVLSQLSYFIPTYKTEYYGTYTAISYALISIGLYGAMGLVLKARNQLHMAFIAIMSIALAFNPAVLKGMWYVHIEYAIIMGILLFLLAYIKGYSRTAWALLLLTVLEREDGGFHLACVLLAIAAVKWWYSRNLATVYRELRFASVAILGGVICWGITFLVREYDGGRSVSNWELMYSGNPPFAHLTLSLIWERFMVIFNERSYLWLGIWLTIVWAYWKRDLYYLIGFASTAPWLLLQLISVQKMTGQLQAYYPFPVLIGFAWPFFALLLKYGREIPASKVREALQLQVLLTIVGLFSWNYSQARISFAPTSQIYGGYSLGEGVRNRALVQHFVMLFDGGSGDLGDVRADAGMSSLIAGKYQGKQVLYWNKKDQRNDTIIYMDNSPAYLGDEVLEFAQRNQLHNNFCLPGTKICVLTNRSQQQLGALGGMLQPADVDKRVYDAFESNKKAKDSGAMKAPKADPSPKAKNDPNARKSKYDGIDFNKLLGGKR